MRLVLTAPARAILRRIPVANVYSVAELLLLALLAVQCARLVWAIVTPVGPLGDWRPAQPAGTGGSVAILRNFDPFFRSSGGAAAAPAVVTSLQLILFGTRLDEANGGGSAIIAGPDGIQNSFSVGQEVLPGVTLKSVAFDHVTIDRGGAIEDLFIDQSGAPVTATVTGVPPMMPADAPGPVRPVAGRQGITLAQMRRDIGFIPRVDGGRVSGLVVRPQGDGTAFRLVGLRDGDIVTAIGGRPVSGQGDIDRLAGQFAGGGNLSITVERGADTLPLTITLAGQ